MKKHIKVENLETRRVYQSGLASQCTEVKYAIQSGSVEEACKAMKECMLASASRGCGVAKRRSKTEKRTRW